MTKAKRCGWHGQTSAPVKISDWLAELDSHTVYNASRLTADFERKTGMESRDWPVTTMAHTRERMAADPRGGEHNPKIKPATRVVWGYSLALRLARQFVPGFESTRLGRGFAFREAVEALRKAGF